ncbi:hypothetical protein [Catenulispora rubra]|uniref:hypothetical protein n=1 Tax=Catenulispora rubra TaxID=280293 RepID=UPI001892203F|nr:hypothetical protein [Catenulispora rubra]
MKYPPLPGETFDAWLARIQPLRRNDLDRRVRTAGVRPLTLEELAGWPTLFASERERAAFLAWLHEERRHHAG